MGETSFTLAYGDDELHATARGRFLGTLDISPVASCPDPAQSVREALENPIGVEGNLFAGMRRGESVVILVSDSFRQTRADVMLPVLLDGLSDAGIEDETISILFSTGTHRGPTREEQIQIVGAEVFARLEGRVFIHDAHRVEDHVSIGETSRGTQVEINRRVHEADHVIATGGVVLHYFGGFGGGRKSVVPGVASARTIAQNHAMNLHSSEDRLDPNVRIGALAGNPVAEDMLEATRLTHVDFIVNTVLNGAGEIAGVFAGELEEAHEKACAFARDLFELCIEERADVVVAASPDTRNFVQTHKALFNAYQAVKPGGRIVLVAPCAEGLGGEQFTQWLALGDRAAIIAGLRKQSEINGQTALSTREKAPMTIMVTELAEADVALLGARKAGSLQEAVDCALREATANSEPSLYVMPSAAHSVPFMENAGDR